MKKVSIKAVMRRNNAVIKYLDVIVKSKPALNRLKKVKVFRN